MVWTIPRLIFRCDFWAGVFVSPHIMHDEFRIHYFGCSQLAGVILYEIFGCVAIRIRSLESTSNLFTLKVKIHGSSTSVRMTDKKYLQQTGKCLFQVPRNVSRVERNDTMSGRSIPSLLLSPIAPARNCRVNGYSGANKEGESPADDDKPL